MTETDVAALIVLLLLLTLTLLLAWLLLRASRRSLPNVFSRDWGMFRRRALVGLADLAYSFFVASFFFSGDTGVPALQALVALVCLLLFVTGLAVCFLAGLQLFGLLFRKPKQTPADLPPQSNP